MKRTHTLGLVHRSILRLGSARQLGLVIAVRCVALSALVVTSCAPSPPLVEGAPRRVIWLTIDALRADHVHYMGYERDTTPNLDALARESANFRLAFSPASATFPSVPAYMTGQYPSEFFREPSDMAPLPDEFVTLPEVFQSAGFETWWFTANGNTSEYRNLNQGVNHFHYLKPASEVDVDFEEMTQFVRDTYRPSSGNEFIYLHTMDVHEPYSPRYPYDRAFAAPYDRAVVREGRALDERGDRLSFNGPTLSETHDITEEDIAHLISQYDGAIRYTDAKLAGLLDALQFDPALDLLIVTADHGEQFYESGCWGHGTSMGPYEFHVPLLMRWDGFASAVYQTPVTLLDLYPTLCDLYGLTPKDEARGTSLLKALRGESVLATDRVVVVEGREDWVGPAAAVVNQSWMYSFFSDPRRFHQNATWPFVEGLYAVGNDGRIGPLRPPAADADAAAILNEMARQQDLHVSAFSREAMGRPQNVPGNTPSILIAGEQFGAGPSVASTDGTAVALRADRVGYRYSGTVEAGNSYHLLSFTYRLKKGSLRIAVWQGEAELLSAEFLKPRPKSTPVTRLILPAPGAIRVEAVVDAESEATVDEISLRPLDVIPLRPNLWDAEEPTLSGESELSDAERARLESLGYLK